MRKVRFFRHNIGWVDIWNAVRVLRSDFVTTGPVTAAFERELAAFLGVPYACGLTSCTAGLFLALKALRVGPGDEVVVPPLTFVATAYVVEHCGARPVFCDVEPGTGLLDPAALAKVLTPRTKAVIPVHLYGQMADMRRIVDLCRPRGIAVVEDAAHGPDMERDGVKPGQLSDAAAFSFYATKNITCGEGGALVTTRQDLHERVRLLRLHGLTHDAADRYSRLGFVQYDVPEPGFKFNMSDIQAALLLHQLRTVRRNTERRRRLYGRFRRELERIPGVRLPDLGHGRVCYHLLTVLVDPAKRDAVIADLNRQGIPVSVHFHPVHLFTHYRRTYGHKEGDFPVAERLGLSTITLPFFPSMTASEVRRVVAALRTAAARNGLS